MNLSELTKMFEQKQISRRQFVTQLSALGITAALMPSFLSGKALAATPKKGGAFRQAMTGAATSDTLDPALLLANHAINTSYQISNSLVEIDENFKPTPELAESWEASPDAKQWTFKLRKGV